MKISIFTTITNPQKYQYAYIEALENYLDFADEVIVIDGGSTDDSLEKIKLTFGKEIRINKLKLVNLNWPVEWDWSELPKHLNLGLEECSGDWAIKMDIDYMIHEADFGKIRSKLEDYLAIGIPVAYFVKLNILNWEKGYEKSVLPLAINVKKAQELNIKYGIASDEPTDWCYPILVNGYDEKWNVPCGKKLPEKLMMPLSANIYNYDYFFRTKDMARSEFNRFSRAYATAFDWSWGKTPEESFKIFVGQMKGRFKRTKEAGSLKDIFHPKYIMERIQKMTIDEFGYNNWNNFKDL